MKETITDILLEALARAKEKGELKLEKQPVDRARNPERKEPRRPGHHPCPDPGKPESKPPRKIAEIILANIQDEAGIIEKTEIAGPGFINFTLKAGPLETDAL